LASNILMLQPGFFSQTIICVLLITGWIPGSSYTQLIASDCAHRSIHSKPLRTLYKEIRASHSMSYHTAFTPLAALWNVSQELLFLLIAFRYYHYFNPFIIIFQTKLPILVSMISIDVIKWWSVIARRKYKEIG
jgi:hypothetical protein